MRFVVLGLAIAALIAGGLSRPVSAIPIFAHQYGVTCEKCHSVIPHLNEFGAAFMAGGYRIPGVKPGPAFPISTKINLVDSSEYQGDGPDGAGLPKAIVDEVELFTAGAIGSRASFFVEQYAVDGGMPGLTRDAWVIDQLTPWNARIPVQAQAGSFTLPLPVDPETFRDTYADYSVYVQTVGSNPFNFFDPKIGIRAQVGNPLRGLNAQVFAGPGHDRQSGLPTTGTDLMLSLQDNLGPLALTAFRYSGTRPAGDGMLKTRFSAPAMVWCGINGGASRSKTCSLTATIPTAVPAALVNPVEALLRRATRSREICSPSDATMGRTTPAPDSRVTRSSCSATVRPNVRALRSKTSSNTRRKPRTP